MQVIAVLVWGLSVSKAAERYRFAFARKVGRLRNRSFPRPVDWLPFLYDTYRLHSCSHAIREGILCGHRKQTLCFSSASPFFYEEFDDATRDGALRSFLFRPGNSFPRYANVVQTAVWSTFFSFFFFEKPIRLTDDEQRRRSAICLCLLAQSSRLYRPFYLTRRNFTSTHRGTRDNAYLQIRLLYPEGEKIIQTMVDYRRGRRESADIGWHSGHRILSGRNESRKVARLV